MFIHRLLVKQWIFIILEMLTTSGALSSALKLKKRSHEQRSLFQLTGNEKKQNCKVYNSLNLDVHYFWEYKIFSSTTCSKKNIKV